MPPNDKNRWSIVAIILFVLIIPLIYLTFFGNPLILKQLSTRLASPFKIPIEEIEKESSENLGIVLTIKSEIPGLSIDQSTIKYKELQNFLTKMDIYPFTDLPLIGLQALNRVGTTTISPKRVSVIFYPLKDFDNNAQQKPELLEKRILSIPDKVQYIGGSLDEAGQEVTIPVFINTDQLSTPASPLDIQLSYISLNAMYFTFQFSNEDLKSFNPAYDKIGRLVYPVFSTNKQRSLLRELKSKLIPAAYAWIPVCDADEVTCCFGSRECGQYVTDPGTCTTPYGSISCTSDAQCPPGYPCTGTSQTCEFTDNRQCINDPIDGCKFPACYGCAVPGGNNCTLECGDSCGGGSCTCTAWVSGACGTGSPCPIGTRRETRTCNPVACGTTSRCVTDATCGVAAAVCGNFSCESGESCLNCSGDCGICPTVPPTPPPTATPTPPANCPNGSCGAGENCSNCPADCGVCPTSTPTFTPTPPVTCPDGTCGAGESCANCAADCGICPATIRARAVEINQGASTCSDINASTTYAEPAVLSLNPFVLPGVQTQPDDSVVDRYVEWTANAGTYQLSAYGQAGYVLQNACYTIDGSPSTPGLSATVNAGQLLTWNVGFSLGTPWVQTQGGDVFVATDIQSLIADTVTPREFNTTLDGTHGTVHYGGSYDFDPIVGQSGASYVSQNGWLVNESGYPVYTENCYQKYLERLDLTTASPATPGAPITEPASSTTPYYYTGNVVTTGNWNITSGETVIIVVNGNLTIGNAAGNSIRRSGTGFLAFIVNGNITVDPGVGGTFSSTTPNIEGFYCSTGTFASGDSSVANRERLVARGTFIANSFLLQRDLSSLSQNQNYSAELFIYDPQLPYVMPDIMKDLRVRWTEVAP